MKKTCTFPECHKPNKGGGLCSGHWELRRLGRELRPLRVKGSRVCTVPACGRKHDGRGYCASHLRQVDAGKEVKPIRGHSPQKGLICKFDGCERASETKGHCDRHYNQVRLGYSLRADSLRDDVGYTSAHDRLRAARGKAVEHACVDNCGRMAAHWSLDDHHRSDNLTCPQSTTTYSLDLHRYAPRCSSCHRLHDNA